MGTKHTKQRQGIVNNPSGSQPKYGTVKKRKNITITDQHDKVLTASGEHQTLSASLAYIAEQLIQHGTVTLKR